MSPQSITKDNPTAELTAPQTPWRLVQVEALPGFRLRVQCRDGTKGVIELADFINASSAGVFARLRDERRFAEVLLINGAPTWPGELDLAPDAIWHELRERS